MIRLLTPLLAVAVFAGCSSDQASTSASQLIAMNEELRVLKDELAQLKKKQEQDDFKRLVEDFERIAYLQPGDDGYSTVRYDLGALTVRLADVDSYANGSRVTLKFGNPLYSSVDGLKAKIEWGRSDKNGSPDNESAKSKEVTFSETLLPGAWTNIPVVLDGIPPSELAFVRVRDVTHSGIGLKR